MRLDVGGALFRTRRATLDVDGAETFLGTIASGGAGHACVLECVGAPEDKFTERWCPFGRSARRTDL